MSASDDIDQDPKAPGRMADDLDKIAQECAALPLLDPRPADEILDFDRDGAPR